MVTLLSTASKASFCIVCYMKALESLAGITVRRPPQREAEMSYTTTAARTERIDWGAENVPLEIARRWPPSEDEIVRAAITVTLVALVTIIGIAVAAILTMG